jgi:nucleotidyltransferase/DNA polymerase involved in DNA repair
MIGLVDCNNFYVSCERLFQPGLRGRPVVVLSNNDGCAVARSEEAKQVGIKMGDPWHLHRAAWKRSGVIIRSSNYALYGDMSNRVMSILRKLTPGIEVYSIDEAFVDFGGMTGREEQVARDLRATILQWTGIPVSIGIAPTKTLAKLANRSAKKEPASGGVRALLTDEVQHMALSKLDVEDIWGVATRLGKRLRALGICTALDLRNAAPEALRKEGGVVVERIGRELRGEGCLQIDDATRPAKSIMASRRAPSRVGNVRDDTILSNRFWTSSFKERRALVPFSSYCEPIGKPASWIWHALRSNREARPLGAFPAIWKDYTGPVKKDGENVTQRVFAFLTTSPNSLPAALEHGRMPVLLTRDEEFEQWLRGSEEEALGLARPYPAEDMRIVQEGSNRKDMLEAA